MLGLSWRRCWEGMKDLTRGGAGTKGECLHVMGGGSKECLPRQGDGDEGGVCGQMQRRSGDTERT